ncbi:THUMP domain-containing class I SAM-dependent RNA methyltransferase [Albidovulum sediminicola]|uniref:Class I SAM-dependent RNA methyltransferase n=1 Tax=Albidovulum sediminicola TaxID=2984331 RepID=A0ABT2Z198_9RHOB|nr:class I SAM-dependent RNA methyltransferase [Defluviimonas sp. WL0075]MCV2864787.1 class I SAM-dependent RNA methyltransferase [Defluviimonas sp. WL0075]
MDAATPPFEIFLAALPGFEPLLAEEARAVGLPGVQEVPGGVTCTGGWPDVWRANLALRGASRVLVRIGGFRAFHLAQLDKRARRFPWGDVLRPGATVRVEATCRRSKIYHAGAATQRIVRALVETLGAREAEEGEAAIRLLARIEDDLVTFSLDTSGEPLHRRGHKVAVNKAPLRETMAAMFLRDCGYDGAEPVLDPMCGSGTFVIEAAEIAAGLMPGRSRAFAFEDFAGFDAGAWGAMKAGVSPRAPVQRFYGSDRDAGAIRMSRDNAERAGVAEFCTFACHPVSDLAPPEGAPGLVMVNPPYGARIGGNRNLLFGLYAALGGVLKERFGGWRVGLVTSDAGLAKATGLPFAAPGPEIPHGGIKVRLWKTGALG